MNACLERSPHQTQLSWADRRFDWQHASFPSYHWESHLYINNFLSMELTDCSPIGAHDFAASANACPPDDEPFFQHAGQHGLCHSGHELPPRGLQPYSNVQAFSMAGDSPTLNSGIYNITKATAPSSGDTEATAPSSKSLKQRSFVLLSLLPGAAGLPWHSLSASTRAQATWMALDHPMTPPDCMTAILYLVTRMTAILFCRHSRRRTRKWL